MISLTPTQQRLLTFLKHEIGTTGVAPSFVEMASHMGLASKSGVHRILAKLEMRGRITRVKNCRRAIELIEATCPHCGKGL